jgi:hypothetical protein
MRLVKDNKAAVIIKVDAFAGISKQWRNVPTLMFDATLPSVEILQTLYPKVEVVDDINVEAPHALVRQVISPKIGTRAPFSAKKLKIEKNRRDVLRYILKRWAECGRKKTLVIAQGHKVPMPGQSYEDWLIKLDQEHFADWLIKPGRLPNGIHVEHFNAIAGDDRYGDVRLLICVGRTEATPLQMETLAGALSGKAPETVRGPGSWWYPSADYEIAPGVIARCDYHPDALVQAIFEQTCAAGIIQAIGRGRAVNRTAADPVDIDILADVFLQIKIDRVEHWKVPSAYIEMVRTGLGVESPDHMTKAWPDVWRNERAAKRALADGRFEANGMRRFRYQIAGPKQKWRRGWYDPTIVSDPRASLEGLLGCKLRLVEAA